jgi:hypothetical protein
MDLQSKDRTDENVRMGEGHCRGKISVTKIPCLKMFNTPKINLSSVQKCLGIIPRIPL